MRLEEEGGGGKAPGSHELWKGPGFSGGWVPGGGTARVGVL